MNESASMWTAVIAFIGFLGILTTNIFTLIGQQRAAAKVEEVKATAAESTEKNVAILTEIKETGDKTHKAVNSNLLKIQQALAVALRKIATDSKDPKDIKAAEEAEKDAEIHKADS